MNATIILTILLVQLIQVLFNLIVRRVDKNR